MAEGDPKLRYGSARRNTPDCPAVLEQAFDPPSRANPPQAQTQGAYNYAVSGIPEIDPQIQEHRT